MSLVWDSLDKKIIAQIFSCFSLHVTQNILSRVNKKFFHVYFELIIRNQTLCLKGGRLTKGDVTHIQTLFKAKIIQRIHLNLSYECANFRSYFIHLANLPIHSVDFRLNNFLEDKDLALLQPFPIRALDLSFCCSLTNKALEYLARLPLENLRLNGLEIDDRGIAYLQPLFLKYLVLTYCIKIRGESFHLFQKTLKSLELGKCSSLTNSAIMSLIKQPLNYLTLYGCDKITGFAVYAFSKMPLKRLCLRLENITRREIQELNRISLRASVNFKIKNYSSLS